MFKNFKGLQEFQASATEQMEQIRIERARQMELAESMHNLLTEVRDLLTEIRDLHKAENGKS